MVNSKKQMFIIIGAFILTLMLGTTTYAFFNYTRTGSANVVKVGRIYFNTEQTNTINLTNVFPIDKANVNSDIDNVGTVTIHVTGDTTYSNGIEYLVSAVEVNNTIGEGNNSKTIPISVDISYDAIENKSIGESDINYFDNRGGDTSRYKILANKLVSDGNKILVGYIKPDSTGIDGTIKINAYFDKDKIAISDTYPERTYSEIIGENTYEVNSNMTQSELSNCANFFSNLLSSAEPAYIVNPNPTIEEINSCVNYFNPIVEGNLNEGETTETFCNGTGTFQNQLMQYYLDNNSFPSAMINDLSSMNIIVLKYNTQFFENFCQNSGEIGGFTFQQSLDNQYLNADELDYLKRNNIIIQTGYQTINSWTDGTSSDWIDNRVVLTTEEWNNLQQNGISFKVKVEANEGIWVEKQGNAMNALPVFNSSIRSNVKEIYFENMSENEMQERYDAATIKADITYNNEGRVLTWIETNTTDNTKYTMYVVSNGTTFLTKANKLFYNASLYNAETIEFNNVDTSRIEDMSHMFYFMQKLKAIDMSNFDTSNVTNIERIFYGDSSIKTIDMNSLDLRKVTNMTAMFYRNSQLKDIDLSNVQTREVTTMLNMFYGCGRLTSLDLSSFNTSNLTDISSAFQGCSRINTLILDNWDLSKITNVIWINTAFYNMHALETLSCKNWKIPINFARWLPSHSNIESLTTIDVTGWDLTETENLSYAFYDTESLANIIGLDTWNTSNITNMSGMFYQNESLTSLDLSNFDISNVTNMDSMFIECNNLVTIKVNNEWDVSNVESSSSMFYNCTSLVGGNGTTYDYTKVDKTMAVIDNNDHEGYLTLKTS